jgi:hypothetical protein
MSPDFRKTDSKGASMNRLRRIWRSVNQNSWGGVALVVAAFGFFCIAVPVLASRVENGGQLLAVVVGAATTGIVGYFLALQRLSHEERIEKRRFRISKLEEAHEVSRSLDRSTFNIYVQMSAFLVLPGARDVIEQIRDLGRPSGEPGNLMQLGMFADFYFPELRTQLKEIKEAYDEYGKVLILQR